MVDPHRNIPSRGVSRERGAVLVLALLSLLLIAAAVFFIFNSGEHLQRRTETQNAADAAAISGANWMARTLNSVAMNNVEITRLIAMVQVLDAVPLAVDLSIRDHKAALEGLRNRRRDGVGEAAWLLPAFDQIEAELTRQISVLEEMKFSLTTNAFDVGQLTSYASGGQLWKAMSDLDAISQTALQELGDLAQLNAARAAQENQSHPDARGFLVPFAPSVPWEQGNFGDFQDAVLDGVVPGTEDDQFEFRGPYDTIFGWRTPRLQTSGIESVDYDLDLDQDYDVPGFGHPRDVPTSGEVVGYDTWGPFWFFLDQIDDAEADGLGYSQVRRDRGQSPYAVRSWFADRVRAYATWKLRFLFPGLEEKLDLPALIQADWNTDLDTALQVATAPGRRLDLMFLYVQFEPFRVDAAGQPLVGVTPVFQDWGFFPFERPNRVGLPQTTLTRVADYVWRAESRWSTTDAVTGATLRYSGYLYLVACANNSGGPLQVRNPNPPNTVDDLPAPINLIRDELEFDDAEAKDRHLRFFAAADQPAEASFWSGLFDAGRPAPRVTATAAAEVFNNHSWDLWTQMWHAQLTPVGDLDGWLDVMQETGGAAESSEWLDPVEVGETFRYLRTIAPVLRTLREEGR